MPIRRHLLLLAVSLLVPAVIACGVAVLFTYSYERARSEENLLRTTQALAESLDRQLDTIVGRLEVLATSPLLAQGDLHGFWGQARQTVGTGGMWVVLTDRDGHQLVNTLRPFGEPLPRHDQADDPVAPSLRRALASGGAVLSNLFVGPVSGKQTIAVSVPAGDALGNGPYVLSMGVEPEALASAVTSISLPKNWLAGVFDGNLALVARSRNAAAFMGKPPMPPLAAAMRSAEAGFVDAVSREGLSTRVAFSRSPRFGWHFAVGVPTTELARPVYWTVSIFTVATLILLLLGGLSAMAIGRRISGAIGLLVPAAAGLREGVVPPHRPTGVAEVDDVSVALAKTGGALRASEAERRRAEDSLLAAKERAEEILSSITDGFYALDGAWRFTYINQRAQQILGKRPDQVLGCNFFEVFPQVRGTVVHQTYARVLTERQPEQFDFISPILKRWTSFSVYPAGDGGIAVYFRDISDRKATEAALIAAKDEAERANLAKSQFLAAASHDLRQPVQSLFFFHDILAGKLRSHPCAAVVATMHSALDAIKGLLDGLLDISRLHAGIIEVAVADFPLGSLLDRMAAEYAAPAEAQGIRLRLVSTGAWVRSDAAQLERMLRNLLDNALKYTPPGGTVLMGCRRAGAELRVQVIDNGPGIPADRLEAVFDEFVQLGNPERDRAKGLGLGLAIVRHLGRLLGHEVILGSRLGHGTVFTVMVPLGRSGQREEMPPARPDAHAGAGLALVVDDEALVLDGLRTMLEDWGWEVLAAKGAEGALRLAQATSRRPDVIIADYRLHGEETGVKVIGTLNAHFGSAVPAVVLTGDTSPERVAECAGSGALLLHKPVDPAALQAALALVRPAVPT
ncbi:MAG: ATP-binding protein [Magnetospirillum sp.]|nr:ATP-binding protein [Magnetospirillum sp.]